MTSWEEALTGLVRARAAALTRYAYLLTGDEHEATELVQDTVVRVFTRRGRRTDPEALEAYVRAAMLNRVIDQGRRRQRWSRLAPRLVSRELAASPEETVVAESEARAALRQLSPRQRACVVLRFYEDESVRGVAERLGLSEGAVKRHLSDATQRLAQALAPEPEGDENARKA